MEDLLRAVLIDWLAGDPAVSSSLNAICEEAPARASLPWLAIATSASLDWSTKTETGREVRIAFELQTRTDRPALAAQVLAAIEARLAQLPAEQEGFRIVSQRFVRARSEQRRESRRACLLEYAFRLFVS